MRLHLMGIVGRKTEGGQNIKAAPPPFFLFRRDTLTAPGCHIRHIEQGRQVAVLTIEQRFAHRTAIITGIGKCSARVAEFAC